MSLLLPDMQDALSGPSPLIFVAVRLDLPTPAGGVQRLLDGAGIATFGGETYTGKGSVGVLTGLELSDDGLGDSVPAATVTIAPASHAAAAALNSPTIQGAEVQVWLGALVRATGAVIVDPYLLFLGEIDQPTMRVAQGEFEVALDCISEMERLFENEEGSRLSDSFHKLLWPGELGLANVTGVEKKVYWGVEGSGGAIK